MSTFRPLFIARDAVTKAPANLDTLSLSEFGKRATTTYLLTRRSDHLVRALAEREVTVLQAHFGVEGVYIAPTAKALGVPLVTTLHGFDVTITKKQLIASKKPSWINYVTWRASLFETGAAFVCVSEYIRRRAVEWGYPAERTVVLPIGVDTDVIKRLPFAERPRIVHVARLVEVKGTADLLRAFATVRRALPAAELIIVGDGPLRAQLGALATELGIASAVRFLGALPHAEVLAEIGAAQVLCLPSATASSGAQEGLGLVLLEAAASGRPVIGTDHGGIPEAVVDGVNGYLVPERDPAALAERLLAVLGDPALGERLGVAGRAMVEHRYDLRTQTAKLESLYQDLI
ncbi:glycosyltransferase [Paractinoplanes rhizophilus]|jgi:glycosyltransferase involved in cell wall biosynthesis|uniref:Glycosyltransferase n=1 Tax=Paractinoplanes rhizophilus TaxID=1416877 RepID=A0ABW2HPV2_9ACTN|nr:glycosyltransferase [Actinoplanes sp.]